MRTFPGLNYHFQSTSDLLTPFTDVPDSDFNAAEFATPATIDGAGGRLFIRAVRD